ncbi:MAG: tRNA (adenosine(37)-N6)-dimethylallyltransferase MiaA [Burkholderiaceae bacterium]
MTDATPWCLALAGPTAGGKTAAALALAEQLPLEVISVDSALVYRGMDIGTAKPSRDERAAVAHHLIDIRDPLQAYNAAEFARDAAQLVDAINRRGHLALFVGGTMLYFKALIDGLHTMPGRDAAVRASIDQQAAVDGWPALHAELARVDPATAARLAPNDSQRVQRALEVFRMTGRPISQWHGDSKPGAVVSRFARMPLLSLEPRQRSWLHARIEQRLDTMLAQGFMDEVQALRARGDLHPNLPSMRCVGYRQAWEALDNGDTQAQWRERSIIATRQLAKRQLTWLRSMPARHVIACDEGAVFEQVLASGKALAGARP